MSNETPAAETVLPIPTWTHHEDGSITIHFPPDAVLNLAEDLHRWKQISEAGGALFPTPRSIIYGNCLEQMKARLGRHEVVKLMQKVEQAQKTL